MTLGPIMLDIAGYALTAEDRELLVHPAVGGVILFARNYAEPTQVADLITTIHAIRPEDPLLIGIDQEGGRVQRLRDGFTRLPPAAIFGALAQNDKVQAVEDCRTTAWLMASELRAVGIDFSFAPVLDLNLGISSVIGDRGLAREPEMVAELGIAWHQGVRQAGMASVGKHFPGHGGVVADSHREIPVDHRTLAEIEVADLIPFQKLIQAGLNAMMPAHVIYDQVDSLPAGFSPFWLQQILRTKLQFDGVVFSDDLSMAGAAYIGSYEERVEAALSAGCDMVLVCNNRLAAEIVVNHLSRHTKQANQQRLTAMRGRQGDTLADLKVSSRWQSAHKVVSNLVEHSQTSSLAGKDPTQYAKPS